MDKQKNIKDLMYHQDANQRRQAAEKLYDAGNFDRDVLESFVHGVLDPDPGVKDVCSRALSKAQAEDAYKAAMFIAPFIAHKDIEIRNLTGDILNRIGEPALDPLLPFLEEDDAFIRQFAVDIIGNIGNEKAELPLSKLINDPDPNVRSSAIEAIGNLRFHSMTDKLIEKFKTEEDLNPILIESLGKIGGEKAEAFLSDIIRNEQDFFLKTAAIDAFALCGSSYDICLELIEQLDNTPDELQTILLKTIFAVAYRNEYEIELPVELRHIAQKALQDDDPDIRGAGLVALSLPYIEKDIPGLINEVMQYNADTQQMILYNLLVNSSTETIRPFFNMFISSEIPDGTFLEFFSMMTPFWEDIPEENTDELMNLCFEDFFETSVRHLEEFVQILMQLDNSKVMDRLNHNLNSDDTRIIEESIEIIGKLGLSEFKEKLIKIKEDGVLTDKINEVLDDIN
jgi:HEAT repeat protein